MAVTRDRGEVRDRLVAAAAEVIAEAGWGEASTRRVADRAGLTRDWSIITWPVSRNSGGWRRCAGPSPSSPGRLLRRLTKALPGTPWRWSLRSCPAGTPATRTWCSCMSRSSLRRGMACFAQRSAVSSPTFGRPSPNGSPCAMWPRLRLLPRRSPLPWTASSSSGHWTQRCQRSRWCASSSVSCETGLSTSHRIVGGRPRLPRSSRHSFLIPEEPLISRPRSASGADLPRPSCGLGVFRTSAAADEVRDDGRPARLV